MKKACILLTTLTSSVVLSLATLVPVQAAPHGHGHREMLASNCHVTTKNSHCHHAAKQAARGVYRSSLAARESALLLAQSTDDDLFDIAAAAAPAAQVANNGRSITTTAASDRYLRKLASYRSIRPAAAHSVANADNNDDDFDMIVAKIMPQTFK
jgi:hypothetical protein